MSNVQQRSSENQRPAMDINSSIQNSTANGYSLEDIERVDPDIDESKSDLAKFFDLLKRRWFVVVGAAGATAAFMVVSYLVNPRIYTGDFRLLIEPVAQGGGGGAGAGTTAQVLSRLQSVPGLLVPSQGRDIGSQMQVLASDPVLDPVAEKIEARYPNITTGTLLSNMKVTNVLNGSLPTKLINVNYRSTDPEQVAYVLEQLAQGFINYSEEERQNQIEENLRFINAEISRQISALDDHEADMAQFRTGNEIYLPAEQATALSAQLDELTQARQQNRAAAEAALAIYQNIQAQLQMTPQEALVATNLSASKSYATRLEELQKVERDLAEQLGRFREDTPIVQSLQEQRRVMLEQIKAEAQNAAGANADSIRAPENLGYQSPTSAGLISKYIEAGIEYDALRRTDEILAQAEAQVLSEIRRFADLVKDYNQIELRLKTGIESLGLLLQSRQALQMQLAQNDFSWQLLTDISEARVYPVRPFSRVLLFAAIASVIVGIGAAYLVDALDSSYMSLDQVKQKVKLPILGVIPKHRGSTQAKFQQFPSPTPSVFFWGLNHSLAAVGQRALFEESFNGLLSNLQLLDSGKTIAITSPASKDGRTAIAANLALAAATMGKKVLLVDADLRHPGIHRELGLPNQVGLTDILAADHLWTTSALQHSLGNSLSNLAVLTAGSPRADAIGLLTSESMKTLLAVSKDVFDLVIFDTPPLILFADTKLITASVDSALLVVNLGRTKRDHLQQGIQDYRTSLRGKLLGLVVNRCNATGMNRLYRKYNRENEQRPLLAKLP